MQAGRTSLRLSFGNGYWNVHGDRRVIRVAVGVEGKVLYPTLEVRRSVARALQERQETCRKIDQAG